ncbi:MAG TPA: hypothetical protein VL051_15340 [Burkholderiaceae bacterium]|nr:hypothetical protein [Burkholderiaceae bacterium]
MNTEQAEIGIVAFQKRKRQDMPAFSAITKTGLLARFLYRSSGSLDFFGFVGFFRFFDFLGFRRGFSGCRSRSRGGRSGGGSRCSRSVGGEGGSGEQTSDQGGEQGFHFSPSDRLITVIRMNQQQ